MARRVMLSSRKLLVREASSSGKVKATGKQPNCCFELIKIKPQNVKRNWAVLFLGANCWPKTQQLNRVSMDGVQVFLALFRLVENWRTKGELYQIKRGAYW